MRKKNERMSAVIVPNYKECKTERKKNKQAKYDIFGIYGVSNLSTR